MAKPTETYVDPSIASDSGSGTVGDPYGDVQYALDTITRDSTNGDRINIKSGTDEVLGASLSLSTYGTPSVGAPLILQGYDSSAGDGDWDAGTGIGGISGNGSYTMFASSNLDYIWLRHLHCHNTGSSAIIDLDNNIRIYECEFNNTTGNGVDIDASSTIVNCKLHDIGNVGIRLYNATNAAAVGNYLTNGTKSFSTAIYTGNQHNRVERNIVSVDGSSDGISLAGIVDTCANNTVYSSSANGTGIQIISNNDYAIVLKSNYVEGFNIGIDTSAISTYSLPVLTNNAVYGANTNYDTTGEAVLVEDDNESLSSSGIDKSGADTFANRATYFAPADEGNMRGGSYPTNLRLDKGAVQHADPAAGAAGGFIIGG